MAYPASMEVPLIGSRDEGLSREPGRGRSLAIASGGVLAMVVGGFLMMDPFHKSGADSVPSKSAESSLIAIVAGPVCKPNWCKRHGYKEDACNCGVCGSYGGCSWTCDPTRDKALHRLRSCTSSEWYEYDEVVASFRDPNTWLGAAILASGFLAIVFAVIKGKAYLRRAPANKITDDENLAAESIVSDSTSARSVGVFDETPSKVTDFGDSSPSEPSRKFGDLADVDALEQQAACHNASSPISKLQISDSIPCLTNKAESPLDEAEFEEADCEKAEHVESAVATPPVSPSQAQRRECAVEMPLSAPVAVQPLAASFPQDSIWDETEEHCNPISDFQCQTKQQTSSQSCSNDEVVDNVEHGAHCQDEPEPELPENVSHRNINDQPISPREVATADILKASEAVLLEAFPEMNRSDEPAPSQVESHRNMKDLPISPREVAGTDILKLAEAALWDEYPKMGHGDEPGSQVKSHRNIKDLPISPREVATTDILKVTESALLEEFSKMSRWDEPASQVESHRSLKDLPISPPEGTSTDMLKSTMDVLLEGLPGMNRQDEPVPPHVESYVHMNDSDCTTLSTSRSVIFEPKIRPEMEVVFKTLEPPLVSKATGHAHALRSRSASLPLSLSSRAARYASGLRPGSRPSSVTRYASARYPVASQNVAADARPTSFSRFAIGRFPAASQTLLADTPPKSACIPVAPRTTSADARSNSVTRFGSACYPVYSGAAETASSTTSAEPKGTSVPKPFLLYPRVARGAVPSDYTRTEPSILDVTARTVGSNRAATPQSATQRAATPQAATQRTATPQAATQRTATPLAVTPRAGTPVHRYSLTVTPPPAASRATAPIVNKAGPTITVMRRGACC